MLGRSCPALLRQYEAGGPMFTVTPAQSPSSGNFDGQTPLRRAAFTLNQQMAGLGVSQRDSMTYVHLCELVYKATEALRDIEDPAPLLRAIYELLGMADRIRLHAASGPMSKLERATSQDRLSVPMASRSTSIAVTSACAASAPRTVMATMMPRSQPAAWH